MNYSYLLTFELEILCGKKVNFFCTELITEEEKQEVDDFFDFGDNQLNLTFALSLLSSNKEFILDVPPSAVEIKKVSKAFIASFVKTYKRSSIGSFSFIELMKSERGSHMRINIGDSVVFREGTEKYSVNTVLKVFARLGNLIYVKGDDKAYQIDDLKRIGE